MYINMLLPTDGSDFAGDPSGMALNWPKLIGAKVAVLTV